ncbi:IclR family transcriptional regulator [Paenibacillus sp. PDC88]|uniref:IclR family transcriptional regulator n=1 Tax=Paenibacillus TaxID=44249 RepID=UPI00089BD71B|nr:IclR family transcriptional regulator C-terminal domain-containing protein [Paenibacillus sp. PDC88]SDX83368.1 transcriptional regulator, IclR family [Paenibacillus sp. PDC88]
MRKSLEEAQGIQSVEIGYRILKEIASSEEAPSISELALRCEMSPSKLHYYLVSFCKIGFLNKSDDGKYSLGLNLAILGLQASGKLDMNKIIEPRLTELSSSVGELTAFAVWADDYGPYWTMQKNTEKPIQIVVSGAPLKMITSSTGRLFAAFYDPVRTRPFIEKGLAESGLDESEFAKQLDEIRERGYSVASYIPGYTGISVPVFHRNHAMAGAITVIGITGLLDVSPNSPVIREVLRKAKQVSYELRALLPER